MTSIRFDRKIVKGKVQDIDFIHLPRKKKKPYKKWLEKNDHFQFGKYSYTYYKYYSKNK